MRSNMIPARQQPDPFLRPVLFNAEDAENAEESAEQGKGDKGMIGE